VGRKRRAGILMSKIGAAFINILLKLPRMPHISNAL
jgi:hypothetical protein